MDNDTSKPNQPWQPPEGLIPIDSEPIIPGRPSMPAPLPPQPSRAMLLDATLPLSVQLDADLKPQGDGANPKTRLFPQLPSGKAEANSAAFSANAAKFEDLQFAATNQPVVSTATDPTGTQTVTVAPPATSSPVTPSPRTGVPLPVRPSIVQRIIGIIDNLHGGRASKASLLGDSSGDTTTPIMDGATGSMLHGVMSVPTQDVINTSSEIIDTAPISGRTEGIGTTVQKLNSSGLLLDVDQIAAQGSVHKVVSAIDTNERALIDFAQTGHIGTLSNYREMVSAATPAIYLKFDETSGTTAFDASGHGLNGTYNGGFSLQQGAAIAGEASSSVKGFSAGFNGSTGFVSVPFNSSLNPSTFSVSMWVNLIDSAPAGKYCLASAFVVNAAKGWALYQLSGGTTLAFKVADGTNYNESSASSAIGTGSWHHVCATYDGTTARLYIDGALSQSFASGFSANTSGQTLISELNYNGTPSDFFHGFVDEFSIHSGALSAQQIAGLYAAGHVGPHRTVDDVPDGSTYNRVKASEVVTGFVKQVNDGTNVRNAADIGTVVKIGGHIQSTAIVDGRTEGVGTTVQQLNSSGLLLNADQIAADGAAYARSPISSSAEGFCPNGNFQAGLAGWQAYRSTLAIGTSSPPSGMTNGSYVEVSASAQYGAATSVYTFPVIAGQTYYISGWAYLVSGSNCTIQLTFVDGSGNFTGSAQATSSTLNTWEFVTGSATVPSGSVYAYWSLQNNGTGGGTCYFTGVTGQLVRNLDTQVQDGSTYNRVKAAALDGNGNPMTLGNNSGDFLKFDGTGTGSIYDSGGSIVAPATKRHVPTVLYSQTNGGTANDGTAVYFNSGNGTPFLQDINGNAFPVFGNIPGVILQAQNAPSGLESFYASNITATSFKIVSKGSGSLTSYGITVNDGGGIIHPTGGTSTTLDTSTDAYNTNVTQASGTTTQVQLTAQINTILNETSGRPNYGGIYNFTAQVWSGNMSTLLASGTFQVNVHSTGAQYSGSITLSGLSISASSQFTVRLYQTSNSDTGAASSTSAVFTGGYTAAASINGVDFIAHITEPWA